MNETMEWYVFVPLAIMLWGTVAVLWYRERKRKD